MPRGRLSKQRSAFHYAKIGKQATAATLAATLPLPKSGRTRFWDTEADGFHVMATPNERVFKVRYTRDGGATVDYRIGAVTEWNLADARDEAKRIREDAQKATPGDDPQEAKKKRRDKGSTFSALASSFLESISVRPNTARSYRIMIETHLRPAFGNRHPESIGRKEIRDHIAHVGRKSPVSAARAFETMRRVYSWAVENDELPGSPFVHLRKPDKVQAADAVERERTLNRAEVHTIFQALREPRFTSQSFDLYIRLLFETAVRRDEMLKATWSEVDFSAGFFTVGQLRYKSKRPHQVPLTKAAISALRKLQNRERERATVATHKERLKSAKGLAKYAVTGQIERAEKRLQECETSDFIFPGPTAAKVRVSPQKALEELRRQVGFEDWTLHDIRRTVATELDRLGIAPQIREAILGHAPDKLSRTYSKHVPLLEMRRALEKWSAKLDEIIRTAPSVKNFEAKEAQL